MSTQESAAPKRRSSAANRRRSAQARTRRIAEGPIAEPLTQGAAVAAAQASAREPAVQEAPAPRDRGRVRAEARQQAKRAAEVPEKKRRFINTERFSGVTRFYHETQAEIKKVNWPDRETTRNLTLVVIGLSVILGILLGGIDYVLFQLFEAMS